MAKYRKRSVVIEAVQWTGKNIDEIAKFMSSNGIYCYKNNKLMIVTLEGVHVASINDYIIKGVNGEFYPCKPDIFKKTYDFVSD
ncbi:MAG: hypothetical protein LKE46_04710 [Clostridium sp.]|jgi:hypothetical protein|uniref:hypothetical protein n=1 Tax=Clostridium sp. TaxID=1506 RepID=UPI0025C04C5A|nr:hypothetical protein [Clostridium sp.]MCH3963551.1 hypothetical protein [Clostridium sp.]MCI1714692.1 hypothetical protein [Clostridium sp.]MCI1799119.1 hypothetical protein [Clostridium sp.]MCI1812875.1 hypothetical protein [Clostridium sp.]MCI1869765.1 hypothetical protein [Clostridium sp.]